MTSLNVDWHLQERPQRTAFELEHLCYRKPFLKQVVVRVDFLAPIDQLNKTIPLKLAKVFSKIFPISEPFEGVTKTFQLSAAGVNQTEEPLRHWIYFGKERGKKLTLAPTHVSIEYSSYGGYDQMFAEFSEVIEGVAMAFPEARAGRFGLRYINVIENLPVMSPGEWNTYIDPKLWSTWMFFSNFKSFVRLMQAVELKVDEIDLRYQFGMPNPDYPAVMRRSQFVLDLDAYVQSAHSFTDAIAYVEKAHAAIQSFFEKSITNELRKKMDAKSKTRD